jgi:hypothetical protein
VRRAYRQPEVVQNEGIGRFSESKRAIGNRQEIRTVVNISLLHSLRPPYDVGDTRSSAGTLSITFRSPRAAMGSSRCNPMENLSDLTAGLSKPRGSSVRLDICIFVKGLPGPLSSFVLALPGSPMGWIGKQTLSGNLSFCRKSHGYGAPVSPVSHPSALQPQRAFFKLIRPSLARCHQYCKYVALASMDSNVVTSNQTWTTQAAPAKNFPNRFSNGPTHPVWLVKSRRKRLGKTHYFQRLTDIL